MNLRQKRIALFIVLGVLSLACTTLTVRNTSDHEMRVQVTMPDGEGPVVKKVAGNSAVDFDSESGGNFYVSVMASEDYIAELRNRADEITLMLFNPQNDLTQGQLSNVVNMLSSLHNRIDSLMSHSSSCIAYVEEDEEGAAEIHWLHEPSTLPTVQCNVD